MLSRILYAPPNDHTSCGHVLNKIPVLFIPAIPNRAYVLFFHGNATTVTLMEPELRRFSTRLNLNIIAMEYPGYGCFLGVPTTNNIKNAAMRVWRGLTQVVSPHNIIVMGHSIGSGPACFLSKYHPGHIILVNPFISISTLGDDYLGIVHYPLTQYEWNNQAELQSYRGRLIVACGIYDQVIPPWHSEVLCHHNRGHLIKLVDGHSPSLLSEPLITHLMQCNYDRDGNELVLEPLTPATELFKTHQCTLM